jgi:hypothetical protein
VLERYPNDLVLVARDMPVAPLIRTQRGWTLVYEDDSFLLFARRGLELRSQRIVGSFP